MQPNRARPPQQALEVIVQPKIGEVFCERYRLNALLGRGGFSIVFDGVDLHSGRNVALKVLTTNADGGYDPAVTARFQREVCIASSLKSVHTVEMFDCGISPEGLHFMVMERLDGEDLSDLLARRKRLTQAEVTSILEQVCDSLDEAHRNGLLHRDLKPANIRLVGDTEPPTVKVIDFGLARATDNGSPTITSTGELIGTPRYMSPEQLLAQPLNAASDIYTLGIMAFEMLAGRDAERGNSVQNQITRLVETVRLPDGLDIEPWFAELVHRMVEVDARGRPQSAKAVLTALAEGPSARLPAAPSAPAANRPVAERTRRWAPLVAAACVALAMGAVIAWGSNGDDDRREPAPRRNNGTALIKQVDHAKTNVPEPEHSPLDMSRADALAGGCGTPPKFVGQGVLQNSDGQWLTYVPRNYDPAQPHPLVVLLHEGAQLPAELLEGSGFKALADREHFVIVAPRDPDEELFQAWDRPSAAVDVVSAMVESTTGLLCIDADRIFVAGQGAGAFAAIHLSCEKWVRAIATHGFLLNEDRTQLCEETPAPHLMLAPMRSRVNPFDGGEPCVPATRKISAKSMTDTLMERHECSGSPRTTVRDAGGNCRTWKCNTAFEVCDTEGGQGWPGARRNPLAAICDGEPSTFPVTETVWRFFSEQTPH